MGRVCGGEVRLRRRPFRDALPTGPAVQEDRPIQYSYLRSQLTKYRRIAAEIDSTAALDLVPDPYDDEVDFLEVYGRPVYVRYNMTGKPHSFLGLTRLEDDEHFNVEHPSSVGLVPNQHVEADSLADDDFFQLNNETVEFQELLKNYTFVLVYTGQRWYGRMLSPTTNPEDMKEEAYHAFWDHVFRGKYSQGNSTVIISDPAPGRGSPVGVDFYEMRQRNEANNSDIGIYDREYGPYGVLIPLAEYKGSGYFHCYTDDPRVTESRN